MKLSPLKPLSYPFFFLKVLARSSELLSECHIDKKFDKIHFSKLDLLLNFITPENDVNFSFKVCTMSIHFVLCVLSSFKRQLIPTERIVHHQRQQKTEGNKPRMKHTTKKRTKPSNTSAPTAAVSAAMWPTSSITNNISNGQCDCVKKAVFLRCCCQLNADE